jgi:glycerophosphoryl diester phosphodiesterase
MIRVVLDLLEKVGPSSVVLTAGEDDIMRDLEAARPGVPLGLSSAQCWSVWKRAWLGKLEEKNFAGRSLQVPAWYKGVLPVLTRRVIEQAHRAKIDVHLWTVNRPEVAERWLRRGVDGIMSDDPGALASVMAAAR